ncbi:hypothetical protein EYC80_003276 [Monilinia laxa]|uniref:Uncharacterized protein n=1 Tax=Monilinia laxa TaxID=61186 RepID=A0A5N6KEI6_MONLA|nr:hypothetical protein EYC80_003276 [Monilinia laxa]
MHGQHQVLFSLLHEQKGKILAGMDPAAFIFTPNTPLKEIHGLLEPPYTIHQIEVDTGKPVEFQREENANKFPLG